MASEQEYMDIIAVHVMLANADMRSLVLDRDALYADGPGASRYFAYIRTPDGAKCIGKEADARSADHICQAFWIGMRALLAPAEDTDDLIDRADNGRLYPVEAASAADPPKKSEHKVTGSGPMHDGDCPGCIDTALRRVQHRRDNNPHRPGTKAHDKWDTDQSRLGWAMDMRGETYWSS